jgi:hypothetical protein
MFVTFVEAKKAVDPATVHATVSRPPDFPTLSDATYQSTSKSLGAAGRLYGYGVPLSDPEPDALIPGARIYACVTWNGTTYGTGSLVHTCEAYNWFNKQSPTGVVPFLGGLQGTAGTSVVYIVPLTMGA